LAAAPGKALPVAAGAVDLWTGACAAGRAALGDGAAGCTTRGWIDGCAAGCVTVAGPTTVPLPGSRVVPGLMLPGPPGGLATSTGLGRMGGWPLGAG